MNLEQGLHTHIERLAPKWLNFLKRLITVPSVLGNEGACLDLVRQAMRELGVFERDVEPVDAPPYVRTGRSYAGRGCVVGRVPGRATAQRPAVAGRNFILNAHMDTAPVEDPDTWAQAPYAAVQVGNELYGRGAMDDKAGVAMLLLLAEAFQQAGAPLPGDLLLEVVVEDEDSGNGTQACTRAGYHAEAGVIIDGTWPFRIIDAHLGQLWLDAVITGRPAAACSHERGQNPILLAQALMQRLHSLVDGFNAVGPWQGIAEPNFLNVGSIHAGVWAGAVPETCRLSCQLGFAPPQTAEAIFASAKTLALEIAPDGAIVLERGSLCTDPFANRGNALVGILARAIARLRPGEMAVRTVVVKGHCDLRHLRKPDGSLADACLYGPGGGGNPHARNEFYRVDHFVPVAQNIASAILDWGGLSGR